MFIVFYILFYSVIIIKKENLIILFYLNIFKNGE